MMEVDLMSKRKAKAPVWQYFRFKLSTKKEPDSIHEGKGADYLSWRLKPVTSVSSSNSLLRLLLLVNYCNILN